MSTTALQSSSVPFYVSTDGVTYKMVVCKRGVTFNGSTPITLEATDCGPVAGIGANEWSFDIDIIANITPDIGTAESYEQLLKWWNLQTLLYVRWNYPDSTGTDFKHAGQAYITSIRGQVQQGNAMNATLTFTGSGNITTV